MNSNVIELNVDMPVMEGRCEISISRWVNEPLPQWDQILTAYDVARLTRRPAWLLSGLVLLKGLPKKRRYRGRNIGWLKSDILGWMSGLSLEPATPGSQPSGHSSAKRQSKMTAYPKIRDGWSP